MQNIFSSAKFYAFERMPSARKIITEMALRNNKSIIVGDCDITGNPITTTTIPGDSIIYTSCVLTAISHLPKDFFKTLCALKPKLVFHFEPCAGALDLTTLHGQLCKKYMEINKYNMEFDAELHRLDGNMIEIICEENNVFGNNPYFPKSMFVWRPNI